MLCFVLISQRIPFGVVCCISRPGATHSCFHKSVLSDAQLSRVNLTKYVIHVLCEIEMLKSLPNWCDYCIHENLRTLDVKNENVDIPSIFPHPIA